MKYPLIECITQYIPRSFVFMIEDATEADFVLGLWKVDQAMDDDAKAMRDWEIFLDMTGNLDSGLL